MAKVSKKSDGVIRISATSDKETKSFFRFMIDDNEEGINGTIYISKNNPLSKRKSIDIKIRNTSEE